MTELEAEIFGLQLFLDDIYDRFSDRTQYRATRSDVEVYRTVSGVLRIDIGSVLLTSSIPLDGVLECGSQRRSRKRWRGHGINWLFYADPTMSITDVGGGADRLRKPQSAAKPLLTSADSPKPDLPIVS